jgi:hypothetical protein
MTATTMTITIYPPLTEETGRILSQVRQKIEVNTWMLNWNGEESRCSLKRFVDTSTITKFRDGALCRIWMSCIRHWRHCPLWNRLIYDNQSQRMIPPGSPESLTELLRVPSLRSVCFDRFNFTHRLLSSNSERVNGRHRDYRSSAGAHFRGRKCCYDGKWSE